MKILKQVLLVMLVLGCTAKEKKSKNYTSLDTGKYTPSNLRSDNKTLKKGNLKSSKISKGNYTLKVDSYYSNAIIDSPNTIIKDVILRQEISFLFKDSLLKTTEYPVITFKARTTNNETILMQENNIFEMSIVEGNGGWFYKISGRGVLADQSEFYAAYSYNGDVLWYSYSTFRNVNGNFKGDPSAGYGDLDELIKKYKLAENSFNKPKQSVSINL